MKPLPPRRTPEPIAAPDRDADFRALVENSPDVIARVDRKLRHLYVNPAIRSATGREPAEFLGRTNHELGMPAALCEQWDAAYRAVFETGNEQVIEFSFAAPDGERFFESRVVPEFGQDGTVATALGMTRDVTVQTRQVQETRVRRDQMRRLANKLPGLISYLDADGRYLASNARYEEWFGMPPRAMRGKHVRDIIGARHFAAIRRPMVLAQRGRSVGFDLVMAVNGEDRTLHTDVVPDVGADGRVTGYYALTSDITRRRRSEKALAESAGRLRAIVETAVDGIITIDSLGTVESFNPAAEKIFGYAPGEVIGRNVNMLMPAPYHEAHDDFLRNYLRTGTRKIIGIGREVVGCRKDGSTFPLELSISETVLGEGGSRRRFFTGLVRDITERNLAREQIEEMTESLERRVMERTAQLRQLSRQLVLAEQEERRRLSHLLHDDLQQLLVAALMRVDILGDRLKETEHGEFVGKVVEMLQQAIDSSRSLAHELSPPVLYDSGLCATMPWLAGMMAERHNLNVAVHVDPGAEPEDEETRVTAFLSARELLFNVVKHAGVGRAALSLERASDACLRLVVEDDGAGFDAANVNDADVQSKAGFGLFSLRERIQFLGGGLSVTSRPGHGTRVEVDLPLRAADAGTEKANCTPAESESTVTIRRPVAGSMLRVLLADDHRILREGIAGILAEQADIAVIAEAANGAQAVALARQHRPDVIVMDASMPEMNGIDATAQITSELPGVSIVGLTMHDSPAIADAMTGAGAVQVLVKDGSSEALVRAIRQAAEHRAAAESP